MIRRAVAVVGLVAGLLALGAAPASAGGNIVCVYNMHPLNVGVCVGI